MKMVVVGGNSRDIGKTSVVAGLISALPHRNWTAIKITQFGHGVCSVDGHECDCAPEEHPFAIQEEQDRSGQTDTSRFLVAGARRALWVRVRWGTLETAIPSLRQAIAGHPGGEESVILESNSILRFFQPNLYLSVLDPATKDFKASAREFLGRADAFLLLEPGLGNSPWEGVSPELIGAKPVFPIRRDCYVTGEIAQFVEGRLVGEKSALCLSR
ncbi:MAG: hypothetical protein HY647_05310 [Acidobacteria bacterium]|nr:hypothetical protein [Acidobacteriota bacterium]